jgi:pyridoxine 4-dehydrogenase
VSAPAVVLLGGERVVRRLGFGAMRITGRGAWGERADRAAALALLRDAAAAGVQLIDTADSYGPRVSEQLVAEALSPYADDLVIATKGGYRREGPFRWTPAGHPQQLRAACEGSLRRLRREVIELYYLHTPDPRVPIEESVGALARLREEGKIRHIGVSNVDLDGLRRAQAVAPVAAVQQRYNLADRAHEPLLRHCEAAGIVFVPWFPLANGVLAGRRSRVLRRIAAARGAAPAQIALAWLLHRSPLIAPIPGTARTDHLRENLAAADIVLTDRERAALDALRPPRRVPQPMRDAVRRVLRVVPARG